MKLDEARKILENHDTEFYKGAPVIDLESGWKIDPPKQEDVVKQEEPKVAEPQVVEGEKPKEDAPKTEEPKKD